MVATRTPLRPGARPSNQSTTSSVDVQAPGRRIQIPEVAVGVLVIAVFGLGAVFWHLHAVAKVPALAAALPIERGAVIESEDVRVVYVASDGPLDRLDGSQVNRVVGRIALVDLRPGSLLTSSVVAPVAAVNAGDGVVGLSLEPGAYPARGLAPGDRVTVVRVADVADRNSTPAVVARDAVVFAVEELPSDRLLVSILTDEVDAEAVAASAGDRGVRLVLVAP